MRTGPLHIYKINTNRIHAATGYSQLAEVQLLINICGFHIFKLTYLLKFICNPKMNICSTFTVICRHTHHGKNNWAPQSRGARQCWPFLSASILLTRVLFSLLSATFLTFLCFLLFKMAPKYSAEVLCTVPKCKEAGYDVEKIHAC